MTRFVAIFLSLYTAMHAVFFFRVKALLPERRAFHVLFVLFLLLMIVAPIVSRLLERNNYESTAKYVAVVAFNWTGFIFLAFCGTLVMLIIDGCVWALNHVGSANLPLLTGRFPAFFLIGIVLSLCFYGYQEARTIKFGFTLLWGEARTIGKESFLYTSRGTGTWCPQIRLLSPPEVTAIELVRKKGKID